MVNAVDTYWEVEGTSLQTLAYNIETLEGQLVLPKLKGSDIDIPHRPGEVWVPKYADSRVIELAMWVIGQDVNGEVSKARDQVFQDNLRTLQRLFYRPGKQFAIKKRFRIGGVMRSATAMAEYAGGLDPKMMGRYGAKFVVNLKLADPYFYDDVLTSTTLTASKVVTAIGDVDTQHIKLTMNGARNKPKVRNNTTGEEVTYNAQLLTGARAELDVRAYLATVFPPTGPSFRAGGSIVHAGAPHWLSLQPGANTLAATSASGTGSIIMEHREAWL